MIEIRIPEKKSLNTILRMHFHAKKDLQDLFTQEVMVAKNKKKIKAISGFPLKFTYTFYLTGKELDIVNCCGPPTANHFCLIWFPLNLLHSCACTS